MRVLLITAVIIFAAFSQGFAKDVEDSQDDFLLKILPQEAISSSTKPLQNTSDEKFLTDFLSVEKDLDLAMKVSEIKQTYFPRKESAYYFQVNVKMAKMDVYRVIQADGATRLSYLETLKAGTAKFREYPKGFGIITSTVLNPVWAPTDETLKEFRKHGIDLSKFRNENGKIIVPPGDRNNFMGAAKMNIRFITPQKSAKLSRDVYRIHGTPKRLEGKLGTRCSGGCTRVQNDSIRRIAIETKNAAVIIQSI